MSGSAPLGRLLAGVGLAHARADRFLSRWLGRSRVFTEALLSECLSTSEQTALTVRIYADRDTYGPPGLWPWEQRWYERELPPSPATVLVAGCGSGRELRSLLSQGYSVDGLEPAASLLASARRELGARAGLWPIGYEQLARGIVPGPLQTRAPYAAIILGWGSFSHVLDPSDRALALRALHRLCPEGPILISFHAARNGARPASAYEPHVRRAGRALRALRGLPSAEQRPDAFLPHAGFIHRFGEAELLALARAVQREICWGEDQRAYGHVTFVRAGQGEDE